MINHNNKTLILPTVKTGSQNDAATYTGVVGLQLNSCLEVVVGFREIVDTHC